MRNKTALAVSTKCLVVIGMLAMGGCAGDGISLNGGVFDALGVSDKGDKSDLAEPRVPERAGLILPPRLEQLPQPGASAAEQQTQIAQQAWPVAPEQRRVAALQQKEAEHAAYCEKELQRKKLNRDLSVTEGPLGNCNQSALSAIGINPNSTLKQAQGAGPSGLPR